MQKGEQEDAFSRAGRVQEKALSSSRSGRRFDCERKIYARSESVRRSSLKIDIFRKPNLLTPLKGPLGRRTYVASTEFDMIRYGGGYCRR